MTLADTPRNWPQGPTMSTLHVLLVFAGIPLLVILTVFLLGMAPGWVKGPRYRPGQPWDAKSEWFGPEMAGTPAVAAAQVAGQARDGGADTGGASEPSPGSEPSRGDQSPGGASAGW